MSDRSQHLLPQARRDGLLVQAIDDEVVVYDTERHKAHCLNRTAARVWEHCDGRTSVADVARRLARELQAPVDQAAVWLAVEQLKKAHLLTEASRSPAGLSRREVLKRLGVAAAVAIPLVTTIVTPAGGQGASCLSLSDPCVTTSQCCSGLICCGGDASDPTCRVPDGGNCNSDSECCEGSACEGGICVD